MYGETIILLTLWRVVHEELGLFLCYEQEAINRWQIGCSDYGDVLMDAIASQITSLTIVYSIVYSDADQRKHQSFASLAFVRGTHRRLVNSTHKWPVTRKKFPFDDVIMKLAFSPPAMTASCNDSLLVVATDESVPQQPTNMKKHSQTYTTRWTGILSNISSSAVNIRVIREIILFYL